MPPYGEPDWATPVESQAVATSNAGLNTAAPINISAPAGAGTATTGQREKAKCYVYSFSVLNLGLAGLMMALAILNLLEFRFFSQLERSFLNIYMFIFSTLLFCSELVWWKPLPVLNKTFRKNFGFLYGLKGKGFYLVFTALLTLGLMDDGGKEKPIWIRYLDWITGLAWLASGVLHVLASCTIPAVNQAYQPPTDGLVDDENYHNPV